jgi:hypothetical protein
VVEEELGVERGKTTFHIGGTSGAGGEWEDIESEDEALAHLDNVENGHLIEGLKGQAVITVSNYPILLRILITVSRITKPWHFASFKPAGKMQHIRALI